MPKEEGDQGERPMPKEERMGGAAGGKRFLIKKVAFAGVDCQSVVWRVEKKEENFCFRVKHFWGVACLMGKSSTRRNM